MNNQLSLEDFIANTLDEIASGVKKANENLKKKSGKDCNPFAMAPNSEKNKNSIQFDVAINASQQKDNKGSIGILVASFGAKASEEKSKNEQFAQRVQFKVDVQNWIGS